MFMAAELLADGLDGVWKLREIEAAGTIALTRLGEKSCWSSAVCRRGQMSTNATTSENRRVIVSDGSIFGPGLTGLDIPDGPNP
jgi:hypothetical protein